MRDDACLQGGSDNHAAVMGGIMETEDLAHCPWPGERERVPLKE